MAQQLRTISAIRHFITQFNPPMDIADDMLSSLDESMISQSFTEDILEDFVFLWDHKRDDIARLILGRMREAPDTINIPISFLPILSELCDEKLDKPTQSGIFYILTIMRKKDYNIETYISQAVVNNPYIEKLSKLYYT